MDAPRLAPDAHPFGDATVPETPTIDASAAAPTSPVEDAPAEATVYDSPLDSPADSAEFPAIDASVPRGAPISCPDGGDSIAYLVAESGAFYRFDPPSLTASLLGAIHCPASANTAPFTMTVAIGAAYVIYSDGNLFRVDLTSLACTATPFVVGQLGFPADIAIATSRGPGPEGLLVYGCAGTDCVPILAKADLTTFVLTQVGPITPNPNQGYPPDMKEDAYGRLFASGASGIIAEIDSVTGAVLGVDSTGLEVGPDLAVLIWRDQIYFFTQENGVISRYDLASRQLTTLGAVGDAIVGAGSAPCE